MSALTRGKKVRKVSRNICFNNKKMKKQVDDEKQALINNKRTSDDQQHRQSSGLEWAESSWTRFLHVLCWTWINPIFSLGYKRQLTENDLDDVPHFDKALLLLHRLRSYDWSSTPTWKIIAKEFWKDYIFASLFFFPYMVACISQPLLLRQFIFNITDKEGSNTISYLYVVLLFMSVVIQSFMERQAIFRSVRVGMRIRNTLAIIIYERSLSLKSAAWRQVDTGQIINMIGNDTFRFEEMCTYLAGLCTSIVEAVITFGLLCWILNPISTLCGYALLSLVVLTLLYSSRKFGECREITAIYSDKRIKAFSEFIYGCHVVKMYNWEKPIGERIAEVRESELSSVRRTSRFRALNATQKFAASQLLALITFGSAWFLGYPLNVTNTFPALLFFFYLSNNALYYLPVTIEKLSDTRFASKRIDSFMSLTMKQDHDSSSSTSSINQQETGSIIMSNASFSWHDGVPCLSPLDLTIKQGAFVGIGGPVGSGKSSLLNAILGEMKMISGHLNTNNSSFSYAAQSPWIFADTFRNNILLNRPFDAERYRNVVYACCLDIDLTRFGASGDMIMIGEKGVNLSGGQKARVALARALYVDADVYLLDDPLSAVDREVAEQIYERCIGPHGLLKNKTRLFITHYTRFLTEANQTIFLFDGHIDQHDCVTENIIRGNDASKEETSVLADLLDQYTSMTDTQPIIIDETPPNDSTRRRVWYDFFTAPPSGILGFCLLVALLLLGEFLRTGANYWLSIWLKQPQTNEVSPKFAYIYFGLLIATAFVDIVRTNYYFTVVLHGSNRLHSNMLKGLLYTSIKFFESNPSGRILNRASKDQYIMDELFPITMLTGIKPLLMVIGSIFLICFINPYLVFLLLVLAPVVWLIIRFYQRSSHQFKQLESITRSPVYALFLTSLNGLSTIRAFKAEKGFIQLISGRIDANTAAYLLVQASSQWLALRLTLLCSLILLVTTIEIVLFRNVIYSSAAALSVTSAVSVSFSLQWTFRKLSEAYVLMASGTRIDEYSHLPLEEDEGGHKPVVETSSNWPIQGTIEFRNYSLRHRSNLECAIKNINLHIESGQKIGIIGRTGTCQYPDDRISVMRCVFRCW